MTKKLEVNGSETLQQLNVGEAAQYMFVAGSRTFCREAHLLDASTQIQDES